MSTGLINALGQQGRMLTDAPPAAAPAPQQLLFDPTQAALLSYATFDRTTPGGYLLLNRMKNDDKRPLEEVINTVIDVRNFYIQPVEAHDEATGEVKMYPWICIEGESGTLYTCGSMGIFTALSEALHFRPKTPWVPAMSFKVIQKRLGEKKRTYGLLYQPPPAVTPPEGKGGKRG